MCHWLYLNCSLSPTATLYELGFWLRADQNWVLVPMVTVVVAAARVAAEVSSAEVSAAMMVTF